MKVSSARTYKAGVRWRVAITFSATVGGAAALKRVLVLSVLWSVTPSNTTLAPLARRQRVLANTKGNGTVTITSPAAIGKAPAATANLTLVDVSATPKTLNYDAGLSDATTSVAWP